MSVPVSVAARSRSAFVMPLVLVLALVGGIMAAVALERAAGMGRLAEVQRRGYRDRHLERGLCEVIGQWTASLVGLPLERMIASDGFVMGLTLPGGDAVAVYMFDGQGSVLTDPTGLTAQERQDMEGVLEALEAVAPEARGEWFRPVGPLAVSARAAPAEVLEAVGRYATQGRGGARFAQELVRRRHRGELTPADLASAMNAEDMTPRQREIVQRLVVLQGELWMVVADVYAPSPGAEMTLVRRYGGRLVVGRAAGAGLHSLGSFLSWEELALTE